MIKTPHSKVSEKIWNSPSLPRKTDRDRKRKLADSAPNELPGVDRSLVYDEVIAGLLEGENRSRFSKSGGELFCAFEDDSVKVVVDETLDFSSAEGFAFLSPWQSEGDILAAAVDDAPPTVPVEKKATWTEASITEALTQAAETKKFPEDIEEGSDYHVEFLYRHFCRLAPRKRRRDTKLKVKWKKAIKDNIEVFGDNIGCMACGPYKFSLVEGAKPVLCKSYPLSPVKKDALAKMIKVLLANDIIEPSVNAEWNSPVLLVSKGDGRWRLVVDYRRVNMLIANAPVVYPRPQDIFETVQEAFFMFLIDGRDFYFQREIDPALRDITTFKTHILAYRFKRMPQGLKPSSAAAITPVTTLLQEALHNWMLLHCDDVLSWAKTEEVSLSRFTWVISKFKEFGMTVGWFKVWILLEKAEYVSHVIDRGRVYPNQGMVSVIDKIPTPTTVKLVQTFIGMCGYFELYIPMLANFRAVLTRLTKEDVKFVWGKDEQTAFETIKGLLKSACLYIVDYSLPMYLVTDASGSALGGCLLQKSTEKFDTGDGSMAGGTASGGDGYYRPIRYMSRSLDQFERAQENRERELRAGLYCMLKCTSMLSHHVFTWCTDHANIQWIMTAKTENQRIARLALWLSMFWYNLQHLAGTHTLMKIADALSRLLIETGEDQDIFVPFEDKIVQHQLLNAIKQVISESPAKFSMSTDTHARLTRNSVEVVPNTALHVLRELETQDLRETGIMSTGSSEAAFKVGGICSIDEVLLPDATYACNDPTTSDYGSEPSYYSVDLFSCAGETIEAMEMAGLQVCASVGLRQDFSEVFLDKHPCLAIYEGLQALAVAITNRKVELPHVTVVNAKITKAAKTPDRRYTVVGDKPTSIEQTLLVIRALNSVQGEYPVQVAHLWFMDNVKLSSLAAHRDTVSAMGYVTTTARLPAGRYGDVVGDIYQVATLSHRPFPVVQPSDALASVADILAEDSSTPRPIRTLEDPHLVRFPRETTGSISSEVRIERVLATPTLAALDGERRYYLGDGTVPSPKAEFVNVITNPHDSIESWICKQLNSSQSCQAAGISAEVTAALEELKDPVVVDVLGKSVPRHTAVAIFRASLAFVQDQHHAGFCESGCKVGGNTPWRTDCASTILSDLTVVSENGKLVECDLVVSGIDLIADLRAIGSTKRKRKTHEVAFVAATSLSCKLNTYEFFCGSAVLSSELKKRGPRWNTVTIDITNCTANGVPPTEILDVEDMTQDDVRSLFAKHGVPDYLHFAPVCSPRSRQHRQDTHYEVATFAPISESAKKADAQVAKAFLIIGVAQSLNQDVLWSMENPNYAKFKHLPRVRDEIEAGNYSRIHLSDYDTEATRKDSVWIHNIDTWNPRPPSNKPQSAGVHWDHFDKKKRAMYPEALCKEIAEALAMCLGDTVMEDVATTVVTKSMAKKAAYAADKANNIQKSKKAKGKSKLSDSSDVEEHNKPGEGSADEIGGQSQASQDGKLSNEENEEPPYAFITRKEILEEQKSDPVLRDCRRLAEVRSKWRDSLDEGKGDDEVAGHHAVYLKVLVSLKSLGKNVQGYAQQMRIDENDVMTYATSNGQYPVPVITPTLGKRAMTLAHGSITNVHIGSRKMQHWLRQRYWWFGMMQQVSQHTKYCMLCQKMKFASSPGYGFMQIRVYDRPGRCICVDLVILNHASPSGTRYLFTILDSFSHYADAHTLKTMTAEDCAKCLLKWCEYNGVPEEVRSDGGSNLNLSEVFKALYTLFGITSIVGQPYAPQSNTVERFHRWLGASLRILYYERDLDIDESLPYVLWIFRATENRVTGFTPFFLHFMREVRFPLDVFESEAIATTPKEFTNHMQEVMKKTWTRARNAQLIAQDEAKLYYDRKHGLVSDIQQNSKVFRKKLPRYQGEVSTHMLPHCTGPYHVLRVTTKGAHIKHCVTGNTAKTSLRHLKKIYLRADDDQLQFDEEGQTKFASGQLVVVRLAAPKTAVRKWQVAQLLHTTPDQEAWEVHWFNSPESGVMLDKRYLPVYEDENGKEHYCKSGTQKTKWKPLTWRVYKGRFLTPAFKLKNSRLPKEIKSILRAKFGNKHENVAAVAIEYNPWMARL